MVTKTTKQAKIIESNAYEQIERQRKCILMIFKEEKKNWLKPKMMHFFLLLLSQTRFGLLLDFFLFDDPLASEGQIPEINNYQKYVSSVYSFKDFTVA